MTCRMLVFGATIAVPVIAQPFASRQGDEVLSEAAMTQQIVGQTHTFFDGGQSFFSISGSYSYTYPDGGLAYGTYELRDGGIVCTSFRQGFERCDMYVRNANRLILITEAGDRFPVRP
ncbi:hypothetical protein IU397_13705 [Actibacterium sp. 188UL27-1]|nr:hypothetical protein [Actibacterium sp. 188UL27-1]